MGWTITSEKLVDIDLLNEESIFSLANGFLGVRGNFEEGYAGESKSIRGTYMNAFHDTVDVAYGEKLYGFPETQQKMVNIIDAQTVILYVGEEKERFSLFTGEVISYKRQLHLDKGFSERIIHWRSPLGKEMKLHFRRVVSFVHRELFAIELRVEPVNFTSKITIVSTVNGNVKNFVGENDPRVASGNGKHLKTVQAKDFEGTGVVMNETYHSQLQTVCATTHDLSMPHTMRKTETDDRLIYEFICEATEPFVWSKWNIYTDTLRHGDQLVKRALELHQDVQDDSFADILADQLNYLRKFWDTADIVIKGDKRVQEGIRFNLYQLLQAVGKDRFSNIAAKGLSGEGYEGHYFWDTEIYMFPVFLMTHPPIAKQLLMYRYSILEDAKKWAQTMGHRQGALFPWRTISGSECSTYFPSGSAQYHISADIAYSYIQYYLATNDFAFMKEYGAEVLFETARLWADVGHFKDGKFRIDSVTGPDEYTCVVNNNYYTNVMAKYNLQWAAKIYYLLEKSEPTALKKLVEKLSLTKKEVSVWEKASEFMLLLYDEELGISPQDDTFLNKEIWDFSRVSKDKYPLLLHYHPLTLYRYQVCKQADTVLAHFLIEDEQSFETIRRSFHYYEKITTHDSSLSSCVFSIMASKLCLKEKAYDYFLETARLDLDNMHGNTKDGLHIANMGGTWLGIVYGFAGLRIKEAGLSLAPFIPDQWDQYEFTICYQDRTIKVTVDIRVKIELIDGLPIRLFLFEKEWELTNNEAIEVSLNK